MMLNYSPLYGNKPFVPLKTEVINVSQFEGMIPPSDIVVATFNIRALPLYTPRGEIPFYLALIYESLYCDDPFHQEICDLLYCSPVNLIVNSTWTMEMLKKRLHRQSYLVPDGIDLDLFKPKKDKILDSPTKKVLMMYRGGVNKGLPYGLEALRLIKKKCPDIEIVMFGTDELPKVDFPYTFFFNPPQEDLPKIYSSCDVFIIPSLLEGSPNPPKEAMACGCAVVSTDWPGYNDICIDQETALVVPRREVKKIAEAAIRILEDDPLRNDYKEL